MKTKRDQYKKERGRMLSALLAFVLAFGLAVAAPSLDGPALAADPAGLAGELGGGPNDELGGEPANGPLQQDGTPPAAEPGGAAFGQGLTLDEALTPGGCSLTLKFPEVGENVIGTNGAKLVNPAESLVVVDVYKIADAVKLPGYQTYQFSIKPTDNKALYDAIDQLLTDDLKEAGWHKEGGGAAGGTINFYYAPDPNKENLHEWSEFVDALARVCLLEDNNIKPVRGAFGQPIENLDPGLYLTVVHGEMPEKGFLADDGDQYKDEGEAPAFACPEYITAQTIRRADGRLERYADGTIRTELAGTAYDEGHVYLFRPQLVSLPGYSQDGIVGADTPNNTSDTAGGWQQAVTMVTKHGAEPRYVDLQIIKQLPKYLAGQGGVTFVYQIDYTDEKGALRSMTEVISFNGPSKDGKETRVIVDRIPLTSAITVTEIYAGYTYKCDGISGGAKQNSVGSGLDRSPLGTAAIPNRTITIQAAELQPGSIQLTVPDAPGTAGQNPTAHTVRLDDGVTHIVTFSNTLDNTTKGGGSVVNSFAGGADGKWTWTKRVYDPASKTWKDVINEDGWSKPVETQTPAGGN